MIFSFTGQCSNQQNHIGQGPAVFRVTCKPHCPQNHSASRCSFMSIIFLFLHSICTAQLCSSSSTLQASWMLPLTPMSRPTLLGTRKGHRISQNGSPWLHHGPVLRSPGGRASTVPHSRAPSLPVTNKRNRPTDKEKSPLFFKG